RERVAAAARGVLQQPGKATSLADGAERGLWIPPCEIYESRSQRRRRLDEPAHERGDRGGIGVPAEHREDRKLQERALGNDGDVIVNRGGRERPPSLHAHVGELLPRFISAGRRRRHERIGHLLFVDPARQAAVTSKLARKELRRRRL